MKKITAVAIVMMLALALVGAAMAEPATLDAATGVYGTAGGTVSNETVRVYKALMAYNPAASTVNAPTIDYTYTIALETTANKQISDGSGARFVLKTAVISGAPVITAKGKAGAATGGNVLGWAAGSDVLKATVTAAYDKTLSRCMTIPTR